MHHGRERKIIRLGGYDYSQCGYYFVTICAQDMACFFGEIRNGIMGLNEIGCAAAECWREIPMHFPHVSLDEWVVMPNHVHGIVWIDHDRNCILDSHCRDAPRRVSTQNHFGPLIPNSISSIINHFKGNVTKWCRTHGHPDFARQPRFHDHIIRDDKSLYKIRRYIRENPMKWIRDRNNQKIHTFSQP